MNPIIHASLMAFLTSSYPPRCRGRNESERDHERYAGKVELVAELAAFFKNQSAPDVTTADIAEGVAFEDLYGEDT